MLAINSGSGLRASAYASLALAFASFGDAFLYPFLPVNSGEVGVPIAWVGVLLSINRFVRIFSNTMMVHLFAKFGLRLPMIVAVVLAILSTFGYGLVSSLALWIVLRITWGLSFSAMRLGSLGYAIQNEKQGTALGVSRSLQELGPTLALFFAPLLIYYFDSSKIFFILSALSLPALYFAWNLPSIENRTPPGQLKWILKLPSAFNAITFLSAILIDGIVVVVLGVLFLEYGNGISIFEATTLAAFYLGYRRVCLVALSPAGGWLADKIGMDRIFSISMCFVIVGLVLIVSGLIAIGSIIVFTFYSINAAITPGAISKGKSDSLTAVAENATWRDIGAAIGTLAGGFLMTSSYLYSVMLTSVFGLTFLLFIQQGTARKALKLLYAWK